MAISLCRVSSTAFSTNTNDIRPSCQYVAGSKMCRPPLHRTESMRHEQAGLIRPAKEKQF
eukprot:scaffold305872_cov24-Prasinocladus_malaysianus.AAC.2